MVKAKKHLGQHFLTDKNIAEKIASILENQHQNVLEVGPGMGMLTQFLMNKYPKVKVVEIDSESVFYLDKNGIISNENIFMEDLLKSDFNLFFNKEEFAIIGNFPYNISSQIVFKAIENRALIPEFGGMFQKEVAERICASPGSKIYGILSVIAQAFYDLEYLFSVPPGVFSPPPKVQSGVMRMRRKENFMLDCDEKLFVKIIKQAFNTRRKMLRTSLKSYIQGIEEEQNEIFQNRPEQLGYQDFIRITKWVMEKNT